MKPFYLLVVFWGQEYCDYLFKFLVPSLLADGNLPAITGKAEHKFLIATTPEDWNIINERSEIGFLRTLIDIEFVDISPHMSKASKIHVMSYGHSKMCQLAYKNKGIAMFLAPDMLLSDNVFTRVNHHLQNNYEVVLFPAIRFDYDRCVEDMSKQGLSDSSCISLSGRELMALVLPNLHSESKTWLWYGGCYADAPVVTMFDLEGIHNYALYCYSWAPLAVDYSKVEDHNVSTFEYSSVDQDYIYKNFGISDKIYVVGDSDEMALASFTSESQLCISTERKPFQDRGYLGHSVKLNNLSRFHHCPIHNMDPLKRKLVQDPVLLHANPLGVNLKHQLETYSRYVRKATKMKPSSQYPSYLIYIYLDHFLKTPILHHIKIKIGEKVKSFLSFCFRAFFQNPILFSTKLIKGICSRLSSHMKGVAFNTSFLLKKLIKYTINFFFTVVSKTFFLLRKTVSFCRFVLRKIGIWFELVNLNYSDKDRFNQETLYKPNPRLAQDSRYYLALKLLPKFIYYSLMDKYFKKEL